MTFYKNFNSKTKSIINFLDNKKYLFYFFILVVFFSFYSLIINQIKSYNESKEKNFNSFLKSNEFSNLKEYIFENLISPFREYNYIVENNDTIEKILKKYNVASDDINNITTEIKKKKTI